VPPSTQAPAPRRSTIDATAPPKLYRAAEGRVAGGVALGLAAHLRLSPTRVRIAFVVLSLFNGLGVLLYLALWAVVPQQPVDAPAQARPRRGFERGAAVALIVLGLGALLLLRGTPLLGANPLLVPLLLAAAGLAVMWGQADASQRERWRRISVFERPVEPGRSRWAAVGRTAAGIVLVAAGVASFVVIFGAWDAARDGLVAGLAVVAGLALVTAPLWWRLVADLSEERRERIRSQERAELAAHLHDSVLQTLTLIQWHSDSPREVARLARGQERELRTWLYRPQDRQTSHFSAALEAVAGEVEDAYAVQVESVVVGGDAEVDDRLDAVVQATREALVNAAKHAGVTTVSLYAEVEPDQVAVFVRDRGAGFDADAVPADRHGVRGSIAGRMERHGGKAAVRSRPGAGTEVELSMVRTP
jgi:signal transduction histidine kinase